MSVPFNRMPPQSPDAEVSVLGAILIHADAMMRAVEMLIPEDFYQDAHRLIFEAALNLVNRAQPVDVVTVGEELRQQNLLDRVGGLPYLMELAGLVPTAAHVDHYAHFVKETATLRRLIDTATRMVTESYKGEQSPRELLDWAQQELFALTSGGQRDVVKLHDVLIETFNRLEQLYENKGKLVGVPTGFHDLDRLTAGLQRSDLIIVAARPSMGKTMLCLNLARHVAVHEKIAVAIFSLEMSREQLAMRL
ncbi:MAG: replicative DNA helicase, partial [Firmicutes bacterium]|nr:replicative DNA helicase [Bacillota bacterium]